MMCARKGGGLIHVPRKLEEPWDRVQGLKAGGKNGRLFAREVASPGKPEHRQDQELMGGSGNLLS